MLTLSQLYIHPIKSCAPIALENSEISPFGLKYDRRWMIIDEHNNMLTQRKHSQLCLIHCSLSNNTLHLCAPGMKNLSLSQNHTAHKIKAKVWDDTCNTFDCGDAVSKWLSEFLKLQVRLVYFPEDEVRQVDLDYANIGDKTAFSDGFPFLLISQASLDDLNGRLNTPADMQRFRPNLVVSGSEPYAEDKWKKIQIGQSIFNLIKPCSRCTIPNINPQTGENTNDVIQTLKEFRLRNKKIYFGQNLTAKESANLEVGMDVKILE